MIDINMSITDRFIKQAFYVTGKEDILIEFIIELILTIWSIQDAVTFKILRIL